MHGANFNSSSELGLPRLKHVLLNTYETSEQHTDRQTNRCKEPISIALPNLVWLGENGITEFKRPAKYVGYITATDRQTDRCTEPVFTAFPNLMLWPAENGAIIYLFFSPANHVGLRLSNQGERNTRTRQMHRTRFNSSSKLELTV